MPVRQLGLIPEEFLLGPDTVDRLDQTAGKQVGKAPDHLVDGQVQGCEVDAQHLPLGLGRIQIVTDLHLAIDDLAIDDILIGNHERITDETAASADGEYRDDLGDQTLQLHLVGRPHLAGDALPHGVLGGQHSGQEVSRAAVRSGTVFGSGLAENGVIASDGEVASHTDLLAAGYPTAVHPADGGLLAVQNGVHHGDEQIHVGAVLLGPPTVVFGVFLGIAAGAEELLAHGCEHNRNHGTVRGSDLEPGDNTLHHLGGVGVTLTRVIQSDPRGEESLDRPILLIEYGFEFVHDARSFCPEVFGTENTVILGLIVPWQPR